MTKKASYITLGCKLNYAETSTYERNFIKEGYESVPWTEKADLYVINTCSVTEHADRKSRNIIRKIHRTAPEATVIVTGCYAQLKRAEVEALEVQSFHPLALIALGSLQPMNIAPQVSFHGLPR